ncbi:hypothetical protein A3C23_00985 [Candidatus Roizmanbacteria bacterium RIFCSPHIGHO2_02_FULL_37_13b]|uniref:Uncharacterized protein n=1 Tax=Candidatus Roizmanbacteria bacterium RIFCSPLOWO2_02_FULL_36_11 TaxID=1802071 RepID=A0A1F7JIU0_9BACT|nr:MAG: hypothetical protein A3C23_00985 [Candidatus Roizmanbacteria bacterium RIFCSPHIGHO2_02_FULL_37_13b]OGK55532.1 MAG: hypothetical protein A3H78_05200 [Candidatus Roizmanbacteria bacterium RIFCSPLOWO2_02_FULL_36_11]
MKKIASTISNTYKALKLLSDPKMIDILYHQITLQQKNQEIKTLSGKKDLFFHKHFIIQVIG